MEVIESLQGFVGENLFLLAPVDQAWQPTDYLPDLTTDNWAHNLSQYRDTAQRVSDDLLVILVGNLVTEEALPNYAVSLEQIAQDPTGTGTAPWSRWLKRMDCGRKSARRSDQRIPQAYRPSGHVRRRADDSPFDQKRIRPGLGARL